MRSRTSSCDFVLSLWTNEPALARRADVAGIDRIGVDLERLGKADRQRGLGTWVSPHSEQDLDAIGASVGRADVFARINPLNPDSPREVEAVLERRARVLMLPMVTSPEAAAELVRLVDGRARIVLLVEQAEALRRIDELVAVDGVDEVHIGLNDLALSLGLRCRWLALAGDLVKDAGAVVRAAGKRFGVGAIGLAGDTELPVPADLVYAEYARAGSSAALVSRSFFRSGSVDLTAEIGRARRELSDWSGRSAAQLAAAHAEFVARTARADCF
jgi:hypothetical protein